LFDGVSFKVERRERIALSGPNGAGKTTLLRILNGETDYQGGELVYSKGTRVALHDQRPPLDQGLTLREYVLSGAADLVATERELRDLEHKMEGGQHDQTTLRRYAEAQARLEHAGGYAWRDRFVDRFRYKKNRAKQAQAKLTQIGRLERERRQASSELESLTLRQKRLGFDFLDPPRSGRTVIETKSLEVAAGTKELLHDVGFALERGEHVALVGPNGSGKTTLLETLLTLREPVAGSVRLGHGVTPAYFSQHEVELDETGSVLDCAQKATGLKRPQAQNLLGRFL